MEKTFGRIDKKIMAAPNINVNVKALYALLCAYADSGSDQCSPTNITLAAALNLSTRTIMRYCKILVAHKIISRLHTNPGRPVVTQINHGQYL